MYKIDRRGGFGGGQKSFSRTDPIKFAHDLDFN